MQKKNIMLGFLAGAILFSLNSMTADAAKYSATLAQNMSPISGVSIIAKHKGFFEKYGLDISVSGFTSGKQCLNAVLGGAAQIATTAEAPTTAAAMAKLPIAFLARMEYSDLKTLTSKSVSINSLANLKGKKIAFTAGTGSEVYTIALLKKAGLTKSDVKLVNLRPQDMLAALSGGDIDAYNSWEPHVSNGIKAMGSKVVQLNTTGIYSETFNIVVMQDYLKKNPELIKAFLKALIDAEAFMKANPKESIAIVAKIAGMKEASLAAIWKDYVYNVVLDQRQIDVLSAHAAWRLASGNHPPKATMPDFTKVIFPGPLKSVAPDRVTLP
ncbi:MAG: NrtA/SsuA/CpmA family ABC transporter substrate-binding protein [Rhodospirillales bacterium]|tara:strand:- start:6017 stop:6997 length:981 start_codon:yes stop_codon:yes gene_type:complete